MIFVILFSIILSFNYDKSSVDCPRCEHKDWKVPANVSPSCFVQEASVNQVALKTSIEWSSIGVTKFLPPSTENGHIIITTPHSSGGEESENIPASQTLSTEKSIDGLRFTVVDDTTIPLDIEESVSVSTTPIYLPPPTPTNRHTQDNSEEATIQTIDTSVSLDPSVPSIDATTSDKPSEEYQETIVNVPSQAIVANETSQVYTLIYSPPPSSTGINPHDYNGEIGIKITATVILLLDSSVPSIQATTSDKPREKYQETIVIIPSQATVVNETSQVEPLHVKPTVSIRDTYISEDLLLRNPVSESKNGQLPASTNIDSTLHEKGKVEFVKEIPHAEVKEPDRDDKPVDTTNCPLPSTNLLKREICDIPFVEAPPPPGNFFQRSAHRAHRFAEIIIKKLPTSVKTFLEKRTFGLSPENTVLIVVTTIAFSIWYTICTTCLASRQRKRDEIRDIIWNLEGKLSSAEIKNRLLEEELEEAQEKIAEIEKKIQKSATVAEHEKKIHENWITLAAMSAERNPTEFVFETHVLYQKLATLDSFRFGGSGKPIPPFPRDLPPHEFYDRRPHGPPAWYPEDRPFEHRPHMEYGPVRSYHPGMMNGPPRSPPPLPRPPYPPHSMRNERPPFCRRMCPTPEQMRRSPPNDMRTPQLRNRPPPPPYHGAR